RRRRIVEGNLDMPHLRFAEADLGRLAELDHVGFVAGKGEAVVFKDDLSARAGDFEPIRSGRFAGGRDEHAGGTVGIFQVSGYVILDLDVVVAAQLAEATHARRGAEQPAHHVEVVQTL